MEEDYILNLALDGPSHSPPYHQETELDAKKNLQSISKTPPQTPKPRNYQSEADFQAIKSTYRPKIEDGDVSRALSFNDHFLPSLTPYSLVKLYFETRAYHRQLKALQTAPHNFALLPFPPTTQT
ncbi:MAG: hypothetical protein M1820_004831 [Bogoriella megaspora]|nr:MAG: hypothetical protein M1820_004831 [Bogoriella megaspora]